MTSASALPELPRSGRLPDNPDDSLSETFLLWPSHLEVVDKWATHFQNCSRAEAVRIMIEALADVSPRSPQAKQAFMRVAKARADIRGKAIQERRKLDELRRQRRNESARLGRLRKKEGSK